MIVSTVVSAVSFITVIVVTFVIANQTRQVQQDVDTKLRSVVDQVNTSQQYSYEFDKRQQQEVRGIERNVTDVRKTYVTHADARQRLETKSMDAENLEADKIQVTGNGTSTGRINFSSTANGALKSADFTVQRGPGEKDKNHLVLKAPALQGAGVNIMGSDNRSHVFVDTATGRVQVPNVLEASRVQLGNKFSLSGTGDSVGNDTMLRLMDKDGKNFYGGLAAANLYSKERANFNGNTVITGEAKVDGTIVFTGGKSELNPSRMPTEFPSKEGKNIIRGDTDVQGHTTNKGNLTVERDVNIQKNLKTFGPSIMQTPVKINHNSSGWQDQTPLSVYTQPGKMGASLGSQHWSHLPHSDGNTYIRPGADNKAVVIGDVGAAQVKIGKGDTTTTIKGTLATENPNWNWMQVKRNQNDVLSFGGDNNNRGIWSDGTRDFSIYTGGANRFSVSQGGVITNRGDVSAPSIGRAANDNSYFNINSQNANNAAHPGTVAHQGLSLAPSGGLSVGEARKMPGGQAYIQKALKVGHANQGGWFDDATITSYAPNGKIGASFGGTNYWSHFPYSDGNTYIRPGKDRGNISIGDVGTQNIAIGADNGTTQVRLGPHSWLPFSDGNSYIRPGRQNQNVNIGDMWTKEVNLGMPDGSGGVFTRANSHFVRRHVDSWSPDTLGQKSLYAGWQSDKTVVGNNQTGAQGYINSIPKNTVVSANDMYVYGKNTATSQLCINNTCVNESDLIKLKTLI